MNGVKRTMEEKKKKKVFKVHFKCARCRGNFYFTKGFKHSSSLSGATYFVCKECELYEKV